jgi:hypothetical protein
MASPKVMEWSVENQWRLETYPLMITRAELRSVSRPMGAWLTSNTAKNDRRMLTPDKATIFL